MKRLFTKKLVSFLLVIFMLASFGTSFSFWASQVLNNNQSGFGNVSIGSWPPPGSIVVSNQTEFNNIRNNLSGVYFLTSDITLTGTFTPIGNENTPFTGTIFGNGKKITGLNLTTPVVTGNNHYLGLFAVNNGVIRDLSIIGGSLSLNATETGSGITRNYNVGLLSGVNNGIMNRVYVEGTINYSYALTINSNNSFNNHTVNIGGLIGSTSYQITHAHANVVINAHAQMATSSNGVKQNIDMFVGGLSGQIMSGFVLNSYAEGNITATSLVNRRAQGNSPSNAVNIYIGGLIGSNQATVSNSFAAGNISSSITTQNGATNTTNNIYYGGLIGLGGSTSSFRISTQTFNITSGPPITVNSTGTPTTEANLKSGVWVFDTNNLAWDAQIWNTDGINYPRLKQLSY